MKKKLELILNTFFLGGRKFDIDFHGEIYFYFHEIDFHGDFGFK